MHNKQNEKKKKKDDRCIVLYASRHLAYGNVILCHVGSYSMMYPSTLLRIAGIFVKIKHKWQP